MVVARIGDELVQVTGDGADVLGDAPFVVVKDADELLGGMSHVVHGLKRYAVGERGIAENTDDVFVRTAFIARGSHAEGGGKRGASVTSAKAIVLALGTESKTVQ